MLPQAYSELEDFFANGYFLAQLLYSLGLMENFGKIVNSDRFTDKNLAQVVATLELIGIELDVRRLKTRSKRYVQSVLATLYEKVQLGVELSSIFDIKTVSLVWQLGRELFRDNSDPDE
jgi:hypothetical protein